MNNLPLFLVAAMIITIIGADFLFFRHNFCGRLTANIVIVAIFGVIYFIFLRR